MARPKIRPEYLSHIGILLDHERYSQKVSYAELARLAGKKSSTNVHHTLRKAGDLSVSTAVTYAKALGCKLLLEYPSGRTLEIQESAFRTSDYSATPENDPTAPTDPLA